MDDPDGKNRKKINRFSRDGEHWDDTGEKILDAEYLWKDKEGNERNEDEIARVTQILCRRKKNNPILVGEAGVGKTAIAEGLALKIVKGEVPNYIKDAVVFSLDIGSLIAGAKFRGDVEERCGIASKILGG